MAARLKKVFVSLAVVVLGVSIIAGIRSNTEGHKQDSTQAITSNTKHEVVSVKYDIPYLTDIRIDGNDADWNGRGFSVFSLERTRLCPKSAELSGHVHLAWCKSGILIFADIDEPSYAEKADPSILNSSEFSIQIGPGRGEQNAENFQSSYLVTIRHPGEDDEKILVYNNKDSVSKSSGSLQPNAIAHRTASGYVIEALLPVEPISLITEEGHTARINIDVFTTDGTNYESRQLWRYIDQYTPLPEVRFAEEASPPVLGYASCNQILGASGKSYRDFAAQRFKKGESVEDLMQEGISYDQLRAEIKKRTSYKVDLEPRKNLSGKTMFVKDEYGTVLAQTSYKNSKGASVVIDDQWSGEHPGVFTVYLDQTPITRVSPHFSSEDIKSVKRFERILFDSYVFSGRDFPSPQIPNPHLTKQTAGNYILRTNFYDKDMKAVQHADAPGRYGAVTVIETMEGSTFRTYSTLLRNDSMASNLPDKLGPDIPRVSTEETIAMEQLALMELGSSNVDKSMQYSAFDHNQKWWIELRNKLNVRFPMIVTLPPDYNPESDKKWPVIIYLHGGGAQDIEDLNVNILREDFTKIVRGESGLFASSNKEQQLPVIVIQPQLSVFNLRWTDSIMRVVIKQVESEYSIDKDRIILTGYCSGANGAYRVITAAPELFAAFIPITIGHHQTDQACNLKNVPTWFFVGGADPRVDVTGSTRLADAINKVGGSAQVTVLEGVGHAAESEIWRREDVWEWLLSQRRHGSQN